MVELPLLVSDPRGEARDRTLRTHDLEAVAQLKMKAPVGEDFHSRAINAGDVEAVVVGEVQILHAQTVHRWIRHDDGFCMHRRMRHREVDVVHFLSEKGDDAVLVFTLRNDAQNVARLHLRLGPRARDDIRIRNLSSRADERAADEFADGFQGLAVQKRVHHLYVKADRRIVLVGLIRFPGLVLVGKVDAEDEADEDGRENDADDAQRIGAGVGDGNVLALVSHDGERLLRSAETRRIGDGTIVNA